MPRRSERIAATVILTMFVAPILFDVLLACAGPDEIRTDVNYGETKYGNQTDIWDSHAYGASVGASWDVGRRARYYDEMIQATEEARAESAARRAEEAKTAEAKPADDPTAKIVGAAGILGSAVAGWLGRRKLKGAVVHVSRKLSEHTKSAWSKVHGHRHEEEPPKDA